MANEMTDTITRPIPSHHQQKPTFYRQPQNDDGKHLQFGHYLHCFLNICYTIRFGYIVIFLFFKQKVVAKVNNALMGTFCNKQTIKL